MPSQVAPLASPLQVALCRHGFAAESNVAEQQLLRSTGSALHAGHVSDSAAQAGIARFARSLSDDHISTMAAQAGDRADLPPMQQRRPVLIRQPALRLEPVDEGVAAARVEQDRHQARRIALRRQDRHLACACVTALRISDSTTRQPDATLCAPSTGCELRNACCLRLKLPVLSDTVTGHYVQLNHGGRSVPGGA